MRPPAIGLFLLTLGAAAQAFAQTPPPSRSPRAACNASAMSLCRTQAQSGDRAGVRACLIKNFEKVTPECQTAMKAAQARARAGKPETEPEVEAPKP